MQLNELISRPQCINTYKTVSTYLGERLKTVLEDIEKFYYSDFWIHRFKRRLKDENIIYKPIELDKILGTTTFLKDDNVFKLFDKDENNKGISNKNTMIALNINMSKELSNDSHIENVIMHEFGHRQYNQREFQTIIYLNNLIINPSPITLENELDYKYFTNKNEIRLRIIPLIKEMYDNNWNTSELYNSSINLKQDDIYKLYPKEEILYWLNNTL